MGTGKARWYECSFCHWLIGTVDVPFVCLHCGRPFLKHDEGTKARKNDMFYWIRRTIVPTWWERIIDWWTGRSNL